MNSHRSILLVAQAPVSPRTGWTAENAKLVFACTSGSCALAELWSGHENRGYAFPRPNLGKGEDAYLREIPLQPGKGE